MIAIENYILCIVSEFNKKNIIISLKLLFSLIQVTFRNYS